ncbi:MAG: flavodoxin family protein [Gammaproteobacteria bacterium]|nr:flavodoxin family protein [Gammaproteobacteria bacterium]MCP5087474.1 flavodoxin family protein [Paracoccaceae bacterium]
MTHSNNILVINGSYRDDGITDQAIEIAIAQLQQSGAKTEVINLRDYPIEFCLNCRECAMQPGETPGRCVLDDGMQALIDKIEASQAYILAAPTNFGSITALFKRFMERLVAYAYWPWDQPYPGFRKERSARKKAMLISSSAAPALFGRWLYGSSRQLRMTAKIIGADPVGTLFTGMISRQKHQRLAQQTADKARAMALKLLG